MKSNITVVLAAYNAASYINEALESILAQTHLPTEIIVVDDASTDGTVACVERFGDRVRLIRCEKNFGNPGPPRNIGIRTARTEYIQVFDADDIMRPEMLERMSDAIATRPDLQVVFADLNKFAAPGVEFSPHSSAHYRFRKLMRPCGGKFSNLYILDQPCILEALMYEYCLGCGALFFSKAAWSHVGEYARYLRSSEDLDFSFRLADAFAFGFVDEVLMDYRMHPTGMSANKLEHYQTNIEGIWRYINASVPAPARRAARRRIAEMEIDLAWVHASRGELGGAWICWLNAMTATGPTPRLAGHTLKLARHAVARGCKRLLYPGCRRSKQDAGGIAAGRPDAVIESSSRCP